MKKRLAIWLSGGIGTGHFSQGQPMLEKILLRLSDRYSLIVYSYALPNPDYLPTHFQLRSAPRNVQSPARRWLWLIWRFGKDCRKQKVDLLFAYWGFPSGVLVTFLGKLMRLPSVIYVLGGDAAGIRSIDYGIFHKPWKRRAAVWAYQRTDALLTMSEFQRDYLAHRGISRVVHVVPWGADRTLFLFDEKRIEHGSVLHCLHVGHLSLVKDQDTLLRAFSLVCSKRQAKLRILGGDTRQGAMQQLASELGISNRVDFLGMIPYSEMPGHYRWAHIMIHPSLSEGQGMALAEAATTGVLLTGTRVGLLYDLGDAGGVRVDQRDFRQLAEKILSVADDKAEWQSKVNVARDWSQAHDFEWTLSELTTILSALVDQYKRAMSNKG